MSSRSLVLVPVLICLACGCANTATKPARVATAPADRADGSERAAGARVEQTGALVRWQTEGDLRHVIGISVTGWPKEVFESLDLLPHLESLTICSSRLDGPKLRLVAATGSPKTLRLQCPVEDQEVQLLTPLRNLRELATRGSGITDAGVRELPSTLVVLDLSDCRQITDAGMHSIAGLPQLEQCCLAGTRVTDAGVVVLAQAKNLRLLDTRRTAVSDGMRRWLWSARPDLRILPAVEPARNMPALTEIWDGARNRP